MKERDNITDGTSRKYKYELVLNEEQLNVIKIALEEYFRIRMNQWNGLAEDLSLQGIDLSPENPRHKEIFERFLVQRDSVQIVLESIGKILGWDYQTQKSETQLIAEDIWQVVRHELWKNQENRNDWSVDAREPLRMSEEPLPQITRDYEEKSVNKIFYDNDRRKTGMKSAFRLCFIYNSYKIACQERAGNPPVFLTFFIIPVSVPHT